MLCTNFLQVYYLVLVEMPYLNAFLDEKLLGGYLFFLNFFVTVDHIFSVGFLSGYFRAMGALNLQILQIVVDNFGI